MVGVAVYARVDDDGPVLEVHPIWLGVPPVGAVVVLDVEGGLLVARVERVVWRSTYAMVFVEAARVIEDIAEADAYADMVGLA